MHMNSPERAVILLIDPDAITLTGTAAVLDMSGYEVHCAQTAEAALKAARSLPLDLIICDVNVQGDSGLELCAELRREATLADVPVMYVSSLQTPDIIRRVHEAGGAYYLRKPYDPDVLIELVSKALWMPHLVNTRIQQARTPHSQPRGVTA